MKFILFFSFLIPNSVFAAVENPFSDWVEQLDSNRFRNADWIRFQEADDLISHYSSRPEDNPTEGLKKLSAVLIKDFEVVNQPFFYPKEQVLSSAARVRYGVEAALRISNGPISYRLSLPEARWSNQTGRHDLEIIVAALHGVPLAIAGVTFYIASRFDSDAAVSGVLFVGVVAGLITVHQLSNPKLMNQWMDAASFALWKNKFIKDFIADVGAKAPKTVIPRSASQARWFFKSYFDSLSYLSMTELELQDLTCQTALK